jgi:methylmalonyl-CoA mutase C-terminal domain/subunit
MIRVMIAKPGLDGHDRGAKVICRALRDAGMEVIYTGLRHTPEEIVSAAIQEEKAHKAEDIAVIAGGIIPEQDIQSLKQIGISEIFAPGSSTEDIIDWIRENI